MTQIQPPLGVQQKYPGLVARLDLLVERISQAQASNLRIQHAYAVASNAHAGQLRATLRPYIVHPTELALLVRSKGLSINAVIVSLLHDTIEDTPITFEDLKDGFGDEIAQGVMEVTHMGNLPRAIFENPSDAIASILSKSTSPVSIAIKLCERLSNMRDLYALPAQKQERIAKETLAIFVPIAQRIGLDDVGQELADLSNLYIDPVYKGMLSKFVNYRENYLDHLHSPFVADFSEHFTSIAQREENLPVKSFVTANPEHIEIGVDRIEEVLSSHQSPSLSSILGTQNILDMNGISKWSQYLLTFSKRTQTINEIVSNIESPIESMNALEQANEKYGGITDSLIALALYTDRNDTLNRILSAVERLEKRQSELTSAVESLRRWAKAIQQSGLPLSLELKRSIDSLSQGIENSGGITQYLEINLPLVPGILNYKAEIGSEHKVELESLWKKLKDYK